MKYNLSQERSQEIVKQAQEKAIHGPWVDQLDKVMSKEERQEVIKYWDTLPGWTSFYDALMHFVNGKVK